MIKAPVSVLTVLALTALAFALSGCAGAIWGNLLVLGITVGIFFGTLALGRGSTASTSTADASTSSSTGGAG